MESVSFSREIQAPPDPVRDAIRDVGPFMRAAGFSEVAVEGDTVEIANAVGLFRIELTLELIDRPDAVLSYDQREGIFEEMTTTYRIDATDGTTTVEVTTSFALDAAFVGPVFDATVIKRQRRREIEQQFDYLQETCE
ncbi:MAG: SRPBCC family protein [Halobacteriaceae archaeon]